MPTLQHDAGVELFKDDPDLAGRTLRLTGIDLPAGTELVPAPAGETDRQLSKDLIPDTVLAAGSARNPSFVLIVEIQRAKEEGKLRQWPRYAAAKWLRHECPVEVLVVCPEAEVAEWYARPISTRLPGYTHQPRILMPSQVPAMATPEEVAADPGMAAVSVAYHGRRPEVANAFVAGIASLGPKAGEDYYESGVGMSSQEIRNALEVLVSTKYQEPFSEFGKRHYSKGREEGLEQGLVSGERDKVLLTLELRGIPVDAGQRERIMSSTDLGMLQLWSRAARTVETAEDLFR
jgi:hypothetical protein